jgi:hypothetical protein
MNSQCNQPWHGHTGGMMELDTLQALYVEKLRDLYSAE